MSSLVEALGDRCVGTVEEVSAERITVLLDPDAPQAVALNAGTPAAFPRINGYLLVPNEVGATVGTITDVTIRRLAYPKRKGMEDFGLVDLPFPMRVATLTPLGTLVSKSSIGTTANGCEVRRGVDVFPSVGDAVVLPTDDQLRAIVQGEDCATSKRILLGTCPTAGGADVFVDPDKLFGRHLAVLGNTGAGKSCSVAGLIRWSLERAAEARSGAGVEGGPNARFIILDPNGEYATAFQDLKPRVYQVEAHPGSSQLKVPAWLWNGDEWAAFTGAAPGVQRPLLYEALRRLKAGETEPDKIDAKARARLRQYRDTLQLSLSGGDHLKRGLREGVASSLENASKDLHALAREIGSGTKDALKQAILALADQASALESSARSGNKDGGGYWHDSFSAAELDALLAGIAEAGNLVGLSDDDEPTSEDAPKSFPVENLPGFVEALASASSGRDMAQFVDSMNLRIRGLLRRGSLASVVHPSSAEDITLERWLSDYLGGAAEPGGEIVVVDLSLVPSEVMHIVVAVLARLVFEALQRYRREVGRELPTVLVLEEAHTFIHKDLTLDSAAPADRACGRVFERIAREGRKFGLGLVLASQRPSEVSQTALSQCNTFLLHRIVNDNDQNLVRRLVPDGVGSMLRELPSLPSRRAILLGWGSPAPVLVEIKELPEDQRPHSPDPAFWDVWIGKEERRVDWTPIALRWTQGAQADTSLPGNPDQPAARPLDVSGDFGDADEETAAR